MSRPPGRIELAAGWAAGKLLVVTARRAAARDDAHELLHCRAALEAGNSGHDPEECQNPTVVAWALAEVRRRDGVL